MTSDHRARRPRLRRLPEVEKKQRRFVQRLGVPHNQHATSRPKKFVDFVNLECHRMIWQVAECLGVHACAEGQRLLTSVYLIGTTRGPVWCSTRGGRRSSNRDGGLAAGQRLETSATVEQGPSLVVDGER